MDYFRAINDKQLGICLRMLYAESIQGIVKIVENNKGKIEFYIGANVDGQTFKTLQERYETMISYKTKRWVVESDR